MERIRRQLRQTMPAWGDPAPGDATKSGLPRDVLQHCRATHKAAAARLEESDTMKSISPRKLVDSTNYEPFSLQGWTLDSLISHSPNFQSVRRVSALSSTASIGRELDRYETEGIPLIIEDWNKHSCWPKEEFTLDWFKSNCSPNIPVRNVIDGSDKDIPLSEFIDICRSVTSSKPGAERLYGKDVECPDLWRDLLGQMGLPPRILPENPNDLLSNQPAKVRVKTLMCYLGIGGTFTPCHKDLCASLGQNLMCYTESGGSAFWFMTATSDVFLATQYFHSLNQELDHERHLLAIEKLAMAPFTVYITEQKLGDLVLVPSRSCHQVINNGGMTLKTSWSRMTLDGLIAANYHELPIYQRVCRGEIYRVKFTIYSALKNLIENLNMKGKDQTQGRPNSRLVTGLSGPGTPRRKNIKTLQRLLPLYCDILDDERPPPDFIDLRYIYSSHGGHSQEDIDQDRIICDFCGADIFQSFFECNRCILENGAAESGGCVICPRCYVDGRTCKCGDMMAMQYRQFQILDDLRTAAAEVLEKLCKSQNDCLKPLKPARPGVFAAACISRSHTQGSCNISHDSQKHDGTYCSGCRTTCSFRQLFTKHETHAVDALLGSQDQQSYHRRFHDPDRNVYGDHDINAFAESVKYGTCPDLKFQRFHNVAYFGKCVPVSKMVRPGYYDEPWDPTEQYHESTLQKSQASIPKRRWSSLQQPSPSLTTQLQEPICPNSDLSVPADLPSNGLGPTPALIRPRTRKRRRYIMDYVEIPSRRATPKEQGVTSVINPPSETKPAEGRDNISSRLHSPKIESELVEDPQGRIRVPSCSNTDVGRAIDRREQKQLSKDLVRLPDTGDDEVTRIVEGGEGIGKQNRQKGNVEKHKIGRRATKCSTGESDGRKMTSTQTSLRKKRDLSVKKKTPSRIRAGDEADNSAKVKKPQWKMLAKGSTEHPFSGDDDSDTVVGSCSSQMPKLNGQSEAQRNTLSASAFITIQRKPSFSGGRDGSPSPVSRGARSTKRLLDLADHQSATNVTDDPMHVPKRRRFTRYQKQEINTYNDSAMDVRGGSEPNCASQLANVLASALDANVDPAVWHFSGKPESGRMSVVHDHEDPGLADPRQALLSAEEREKYEKKIEELSNRVAALEKSQDESKAVDFIINRIKEFIPSQSVTQPQPLYYLPIPVGQVEGGRFPAQNEAYRGNQNQYFGYQHPQYPSGPYKLRHARLPAQNEAHRGNQYFGQQYPQYPSGPCKYRHAQVNRMYGQNSQDQRWRNGRVQRPSGNNYHRDRQQGHSYQSHGVVTLSEANKTRRFNQWGSPLAGPSDTSRYPRKFMGGIDGSIERWSSPFWSLPDRPPAVSLPSPSHHGEHGALEGDSERHDNDNQQAQGEVTVGWGLSHGWDSIVGNNTVTNEEQDSHWEDSYVQEDDGFGNNDTTGEKDAEQPKRVEDSNSGKAEAVPGETHNPWTS